MTTGMNILVVEDDAFLLEGLDMLLTKEGYAVQAAATLSDARAKLSGDVSLLILDVGLPDGSGYDFCAEVRQRNPYLPILFLTARDEEYEVVRGLELGANDYVTKPFRSLELLARVRALLRRPECAALGTDTVTLNQTRLSASIGERTVSLTPTEFSLLQKLIVNKGQILSRDQLQTALWDLDGAFIDDNTLSVHIFRLRDKIGHDAIETVRGVGYCWRGIEP